MTHNATLGWFAVAAVTVAGLLGCNSPHPASPPGTGVPTTQTTPVPSRTPLAGSCYVGDAVDATLGRPLNFAARGDWGAIDLSWENAGPSGSCVILWVEWAQGEGFAREVLPFDFGATSTLDSRAYPPGTNAVFYTLYSAGRDGRSQAATTTFARPDRGTPPAGLPGTPLPGATRPLCYVGDAVDPSLDPPSSLVIEGGWTSGLRPKWSLPAGPATCLVLTANWVDEFGGVEAWLRILPPAPGELLDLTPYPANGQDITYRLFVATVDTRSPAIEADYHSPVVDFTSPSPSP